LTLAVLTVRRPVIYFPAQADYIVIALIAPLRAARVNARGLLHPWSAVGRLAFKALVRVSLVVLSEDVVTLRAKAVDRFHDRRARFA